MSISKQTMAQSCNVIIKDCILSSLKQFMEWILISGSGLNFQNGETTISGRNMFSVTKLQ